MKSLSIPTDGLQFEEKRPFFLIRRDEKLIGYQMDEVLWERKEPEKIDLSGVTKITYGFGGEKPDILGVHFTIEDPEEILLWAAAHKNHTLHSRHQWTLVPVSADAGFPMTRMATEVFGGCMCSLALRFHGGEKLLLEIKGHFHESPRIDEATSNDTLHFLTASKVASLKSKNPPSDSDSESDSDSDSDANFDPFADETSKEK